ncbi:hypothetical protein ASF22_04375 [Methylobacterium sp. Leaf87]|nr:hypothetical protein ASF22_04375 [Methylobacterium sp. Leaf87]
MRSKARFMEADLMDTVTPSAPLRAAGSSGRLPGIRGRLAGWAARAGFAEVRSDRPTTGILLSPEPGGRTLLLTDRRGPEPRTYRLDTDADDFAERLSAIRGGGRGLGAKILLDPAQCFVRTLTLPTASLPRMREVLVQELEAATPFRAEGVYSDWYVEGEDAATRTLRVRHVVIKRVRLDPLLAAMGRAGLVPGPVAVGGAETTAMPVDLLSGGRRAIPPLLRGLGLGDLALLALAGLLLLGSLVLVQDHRGATLAALDDAILDARGAPSLRRAPLPAGAAAILAGAAARPSLAPVWSAVADALPDAVSAEALRLDAQGLTLTLLVRDATDPLPRLAALPGFGPAAVLDAPEASGAPRRLTVRLPHRAPEPMP